MALRWAPVFPDPEVPSVSTAPAAPSSGVTGPAPFDCVPRWLRDLGLHPYVTYAALTSYADSEGGCFPGVEALAERAMISKRATQLAIRTLEEAGAIRVERRRRRDGGQASNMYLLLAWDPGAHRAWRERTYSFPPMHDLHPNENQVNEKTDSRSENPGRDLPPARDEAGHNPVVDGLCDAIAEHVVFATEGKRPEVTKAWRREVRLMIDADGWTITQVEYVLQWLRRSTASAIFWRANILSAPTLRRQMPKLRAAILRERQTPAPTTGGVTPDVMDGFVDDGLGIFEAALERGRAAQREREAREAASQ